MINIIYTHDIFLSHSSKDKIFVRWIAKELRNRGLTVWFDEWSISAGENIYFAIERGLQNSRVQLLFMSNAALNSEWVNLERSTIGFRDPNNTDKSLIPVLVKKCPLPDTLSRLKYVDATNGQKSKTIKQLIAALPDNIKSKISKNNNQSTQQFSEYDRAKYSLLQSTEELKAISPEYKNPANRNHYIIDRLQAKIDIYVKLDKIRSLANISPIHLYFIDIDGFTLINAKYGKLAGDAVISSIQIMAQELYGAESVSYWNADEFIVSSIGLHENEPITISQKFCKIIRSHRWDNIAPGLFATISIGIAQYQANKQEETVDWFERAIIGSFNAKKNGGNQAAVGPIIGHRLINTNNSDFIGIIDQYKDYQWPIPQIRYISSGCS